MNYKEESLKKHYEWNGKIEVVSRCEVNDRHALSLAYTPGVAEACLVIKDDVNKSFELTRRSNLVAVVTDGTAVLGLGDIAYINEVAESNLSAALIDKLLPVVSAADNGKILSVVNGEWTVTTPTVIYVGVAQPANETGNDGDLYLQTD